MWVKGIARNCAKSYFRHHREAIADVEWEVLPASSPDPAELLVRAEFRLELAGFLGKLSERERDQLRRYFNDQFTFAQIAQQNGEKLSAVTARHYRAIDKLRSLVGEALSS